MNRYGFAAVCVAAAGYIAGNGHTGWGWLVFLAVVALLD